MQTTPPRRSRSLRRVRSVFHNSGAAHLALDYLVCKLGRSVPSGRATHHSEMVRWEKLVVDTEVASSWATMGVGKIQEKSVGERRHGLGVARQLLA